MPSYSLPFSRPMVLAALFGLAGSDLAEGSELLLPTAENSEPLDRPILRVTINASGVISLVGAAPIECDGTCEVIVPALAAPLRAFHEREPEGAVLLVGDRRADFHDVRALLATMNSAGLVWTYFQTSPEGTPLRALHLAQFVKEGSESAPLIDDGRTDAPPAAVHAPPAPLLVTLSKEGVSFGRDWNRLINVPRTAEGALPLSTLEVLLAEDRRLHPSAGFVIVNTNDQVTYGDMVTVFDRTRGYGYEETLAAGGPPTGAWGSPARTPQGPVTIPTSVTLLPGGGIDARDADGSLRLVRHDQIRGFEAHCDDETCDLVADTYSGRIALGEGVIPPTWPALFARPLFRVGGGRLGGASPTRTGTLSPLVQSPGMQAPGGGDIHPGERDKSSIDAVIEKQMPSLRNCYAQVLGTKASLAGKVMMRLVIAADGTVSTSTMTEGAFADPAFEACALGVVDRLRFPPIGSGIVIVSYPFIFGPG